MAGTKEGGKKAAESNMKRYGPDFYSKIGSKGGTNGKGVGYGGGFSAGEEGRTRARIYGRIGGKISKRGPTVKHNSEYTEGDDTQTKIVQNL